MFKKPLHVNFKAFYEHGQLGHKRRQLIRQCARPFTRSLNDDCNLRWKLHLHTENAASLRCACVGHQSIDVLTTSNNLSNGGSLSSDRNCKGLRLPPFSPSFGEPPNSTCNDRPS